MKATWVLGLLSLILGIVLLWVLWVISGEIQDATEYHEHHGTGL